MNIVSITSQGQISIPAKLRRQLGFVKGGKAVVGKRGDKLVIQPAQGVGELFGVLQEVALEGVEAEEVQKREEKAREKAVVDKYRGDNE